jgi:hypothetical protein
MGSCMGGAAWGHTRHQRLATGDSHLTSAAQRQSPRPKAQAWARARGTSTGTVTSAAARHGDDATWASEWGQSPPSHDVGSVNSAEQLPGDSHRGRNHQHVGSCMGTHTTPAARHGGQSSHQRGTGTVTAAEGTSMGHEHGEPAGDSHHSGGEPAGDSHHSGGATRGRRDMGIGVGTDTSIA